MHWALQKSRSHDTGGEDPEGCTLLREKLSFGEEGNMHHEQPVNTQFRISEKLARTWEKPLYRARKKKPSHAIKLLMELRLWG